ncbi:MAG TPA: helix-turn-helix domain-containing protein [Thermoanaerobaculia bacterium]|nr:helix-turn-helix domain-containing protein [Thermoanaerobaculia bacterium]
MDDVFRALADPTRRSLLDELFERDGQTLGGLERRLPTALVNLPQVQEALASKKED